MNYEDKTIDQIIESMEAPSEAALEAQLKEVKEANLQIENELFPTELIVWPNTPEAWERFTKLVLKMHKEIGTKHLTLRIIA